ncbi:DNA polymerase alpha/epsilon subunit B-domain-containing protein [Lipomyces arxii]|uniref:DNA polymerase alpha/epsilon subunit B-domain-containing protein n=1 Tax=Lipomyces arxii TaxID=56418 RepID=UPI0034CE8DE0
MPSQELQSFSFKKPSSKTQQTRSIRSPSPSTLAPLPIELQPIQVRPVVYRVLSKKYGLNLKATGLELFAEYLGRKFGRDWRTKCEPFLDQVGRRWKGQDRGLFVDRRLLQVVIREVELRSASFTNSATVSASQLVALESVQDPFENFCPQEFLHVWDAFSQPRWIYNYFRKHFERGSTPTSFPSAKHQVHVLQSRYHLLYHRLLRSEEFQPPSFHSSNAGNWHAISQIKNLLGRHGKSFLLLALLVKGSNGNWWAEDPSGRVELEFKDSIAGAGYFVEGCILLFDGVYNREEKFYVRSVRHPPCEPRDKSREAYGYLDFMGIGGIGSTPDGRFDKDIELKMLAEEQRRPDTNIVVLGCDLFLDQVKTIEALNKVFSLMEDALPLAIVLSGSFISLPFCDNGASSLYKESFDHLAEVLSQYPKLCASTTFIFVPGNNDPWGSTASAGGPIFWPQRSIPEIFTNQVRRTLKKSFWASNPCRICYFSQEILICRDDMASRLRRNGLVLKTQSISAAKEDTTEIIDQPTQENSDTQVDDDYLTEYSEVRTEEDIETEKMVQTVLDQGHISPWATTLRPSLSEYEHVLSLAPLPTTVILCDPTSALYQHAYNDCGVMNPSKFVPPARRRVTWIEYSTCTRSSRTASCHF